MTAFGIPEKPPLEDVFRRIDALATSALRTIPYVGPDLAEFFTRVVVPVCGPRRDRMLTSLRKCSRSLEGGLQVLLMRFLPLPTGPPDEPERS
jgi:hypothetical protein